MFTQSEDGGEDLDECKDEQENNQPIKTNKGEIKPTTTYLEDLQYLNENSAKPYAGLVPEPLSPALDKKGYLDALPIINNRYGGGDFTEPNAFRYQGFGKYRKQKDMNNNAKKDQNGEDTDGQYDSDIDASGQNKDSRKKCKHRSIKNSVCLICGYKITRFGSFFDSETIPRYMRILQISDSEECAEAIGKEVDLIYEAFSPTNIIQMRDHIQTVIGRSLVSHIKRKGAADFAYRVLPQEALYSDALEHVKSYQQYRKDFKEQKINVCKSNALFIDSNFESGNIEKVFKNRVKISQEYHLFMNVDTNTRGHQQWFYFRVRNMKRDTNYKFTIWNFTKPKSLYRDGMKPMWRSKKKSKILECQNEEDGWEFIPDENIVGDVDYCRSHLTRSKEKKGQFDNLFDQDEEKKKQKNGEDAKQQYIKQFRDGTYYFSLSFTLTFDYNKDTVFIAYSRPYRYTSIIYDLLKCENELMERAQDRYTEEMRNEPCRWDGEADIQVPNQIVYSRKLMCLTVSGLPCPILTISAPKNQGKKYRQREAIIVTSRLHPGETNSSFVFSGLLDLLIKVDPISQYLRDNFVFKLVPCMNPDGVVRGNYRSSFAGVDLNRQWVLPNETLHPTVFNCKAMIEKTFKERPILIYCDLHGHSRKTNSFMYGCNRAANGGFNSWTKVRLFPRILARTNHVFDMNSCKFKVEKGKLGTGRVVIWKEFEVTNSFTLENSFHGFDYGDQFKEFTPVDFRKLGADILTSVHQYKRVLDEIQKELNITKGWLKPKRLLEVTGQTAQERLRQEAKEQKMLAKKSRTMAVSTEEQKDSKKQQSDKPPINKNRGPVINTRGGPSITLQGLIDQYVTNRQTKDDLNTLKVPGIEKAHTQGSISPRDVNTKGTPNNKKGSKVNILNSRTIVRSNDNGTPLVVKERSNSRQKRNEVGVDGVKAAQNYEKLITYSIIKVQSFARMIIQRTKYIEMQAKKEENELEQLVEDEAGTPSTIFNNGPRTDNKSPSDSGLHLKEKSSSKMEDKYLKQLTLEMIESETVTQKRLQLGKNKLDSKPGTAEVNTRMQLTIDSTVPVAELDSENLYTQSEQENVMDTIDDLKYTIDQKSTIATIITDNSGGMQSIKNDWRQYFSPEELITAFEKIQKGEDPNDDEVEEQDVGSDSCPSEDNLELKDLYGAIYVEKNKMNENMEARQKAEDSYNKDFANFVKKIHRKVRDASKDSCVSQDFNLSKNKNDRVEGHRAEMRKRNSGYKLEGSMDRQNSRDTTLKIEGKGQNSLEPPEDTGSCKRQGKAFIIGSTGKRVPMNAAALSPNAQKNIQQTKLKVGGRVIGVSDQLKKAMNIKARRLRSQDANNLSTGGIRDKADQTQNKATNSVNKMQTVDRSHRVSGIAMSQKKTTSFLPILSSKLSQDEVQNMTQISEREGRKSPVLTSSGYVINDAQTTMYQQSTTHFKQDGIMGSRNSIQDLQRDINHHQQLNHHNSMSMNNQEQMMHLNLPSQQNSDNRNQNPPQTQSHMMNQRTSIISLTSNKMSMNTTGNNFQQMGQSNFNITSSSQQPAFQSGYHNMANNSVFKSPMTNDRRSPIRQVSMGMTQQNQQIMNTPGLQNNRSPAPIFNQAQNAQHLKSPQPHGSSRGMNPMTVPRQSFGLSSLVPPQQQQQQSTIPQINGPTGQMQLQNDPQMMAKMQAQVKSPRRTINLNPQQMTAMQLSKQALMKKSGSPFTSNNNSQYADQITKQDESQVQIRDFGDDLETQKSIRQYPVPSIGGSHRSPQVNTKMPMKQMMQQSQRTGPQNTELPTTHLNQYNSILSGGANSQTKHLSLAGIQNTLISTQTSGHTPNRQQQHMQQMSNNSSNFWSQPGSNRMPQMNNEQNSNFRTPIQQNQPKIQGIRRGNHLSPNPGSLSSNNNSLILPPQQNQRMMAQGGSGKHLLGSGAQLNAMNRNLNIRQ